MSKAFLLAGGLGTRLKPLTETVPKCLVKINDKPLLGWWADLMEIHGIDEVLINLHHLKNQIIDFIKSYPTKIKFHYYYEEKLLGSAGTLRENKTFVKNENYFFVFYADNLTNYDLTEFADFHVRNEQLLSMALFQTDEPNMCGIVDMDENDIIKDFEEKPKVPKSNLANAGLYVAKPEVLELIPYLEITDIGYHLLPKLIGNMAGWKAKGYLIDIGNFKNLNIAKLQWPKIING